MDRVSLRVAHFEDVVDRIARFATFQIADRVYSAGLLIPQVVINSKDLITESSSASAFVLYWGVTASSARRHKARVEAAYRQWRDRKLMEAKDTPIGENKDGSPKYPTDAVAERMYRTDPDYGLWRGKMDDAQESAEMAEAICEAFRVKAEMIKAQERLLHDEAGGAYVVSEDPRRTVVREPEMEK